MFVDRRSVPRPQAAEPAKAILSAHRRVPCVITDLNEKGARLGFGDIVQLPKAFEIAVSDDPRRNLTVHTVWQHGRAAGVQFHPTMVERVRDLIVRLIP